MPNAPQQGVSENRPSYFEHVAQLQLSGLLHPALESILSSYTSQYPRYLLPLLNNFDEIYALVFSVIEYHYLSTAGKFLDTVVTVDSFYGLRRRNILPKQKNRRRIIGMPETVNKLSKRDIISSLLFLVGAPYIMIKLKNIHENVTGGEAGRILGINDQFLQESLENETAIKELCFVIKSHIFAALQIISHQDYIFQKIRSIRSLETQQKLIEQLSKSKGFHFLFALVRISLSKGVNAIKTVLPLSVFCIQFIEWWYTSDFHKKGRILPIPPPPPPIAPHEQGLKIPSDHSICPICLKTRINAAMLPSGY
ncbi:ubiquitin-protein ligase peroxin 12, partial [Nowakowskiella sp. JEL0078]